MDWNRRQTGRFYRSVVYTGLLLRNLFRIRILVSGQENLPHPDPIGHKSRIIRPGTGAVVAITHFGYLDFAFAEIVLWKWLKAESLFLVTKTAMDNPLAGPLIRACGQITVDRTAGAGAYQDAVARLRAGEYVAVLPEAGVSRSFTVRNCKTGAVRMAADAGVPIIPISVWGSHRLMSRGHAFSIRRAWRAPVMVHIGEPLRLPEEIDAVVESVKLRKQLQDGIDAGMADFPIPATPGSWWIPAHLGGGAPTIAQQEELDKLDRPGGSAGLPS